MNQRILRNSAKCKRCGDEVVHMMAWCSCRKVGVDGGHEYIRRLGKPEDRIETSKVLGAKA
ncbi:DUF7695 domain-containing protein [Myxococcus landrumensis]|uniref:DUF7695 domain-containing protein n=1 Tax=Myxococcus landrumensis TaxID=2813577 RepID=A0ABX7N9H1_9BACT|nr:hypothetical protein [Myxococcus landrumus]QSQ14071.1 hypothetical protein JY572_38115 [Myxococcus landrumus]